MQRSAAGTETEKTSHVELGAAVFPTELGWMALLGRDDVLHRLSFGHRTPAAARRALEVDLTVDGPTDEWGLPLARRLTAYARGEYDDFSDIAVHSHDASPFQRRVIAACREIAYGETLSYAELATRAGAPRGARAVGNVMSINRTPLVVPCHRVVRTGGGMGGYSAGEGVRLKLRLLELEANPILA